MNRETTLCAGSSHIEQFTYDSDLSMLEVGFRDGSFYTYSAVPPEVALAFQRSGSRGSFFVRQIKSRYADEEGRLPPVDDQA